jgi:hypothetical protein
MNLKKIIFILFFTLIAQLVLGVEVLAADSLPLEPSVRIPEVAYDGDDGGSNSSGIITIKGDFSALKNYISKMYKFGMAITGILGVIVLALGGITWLTSGGNANSIAKAKQYIWGSITGLVLALLSYTILNMVNPDIVNLVTTEKITILNSVEKGCGWQKTECNDDFQVKRSKSEEADSCGTKPLKNNKPDSDYKHCCCNKETADPKVLALQGCAEKLNDKEAITLTGSSTVGGNAMTPEYEKSICEDHCENQGGAKNWGSVNVVAFGTNNVYGCCVCKQPVKLEESDQCITDAFCKVYNPSYICCTLNQINKCMYQSECSYQAIPDH